MTERVWWVVAVAGVAIATVAGPSAPAVARTDAACGTAAGVTVVVDFGPYGGVEVGCAPDTGTGLEALEAAGFTWTGTAQYGNFVCRIDGLPTVDDDQCVRTPPATAYWVYWHAERGGAWTYSSQGASGYDPPAGSVDGWSFGAGAPPGSPPPPPIPSPPPPPPSPPPPTSTPASEAASEPGPADEDEPTSSTPPSGSAAPPDVTTTAATTGSASTGSPTVSDSGSAGSTTEPPAHRSTGPSAGLAAGSTAVSSGGSPLGTLLGLLAAAVVAVTGGVVALRRRRAAPTR